jgi:propionyl-CoA carboxylase alpha chain
MNGGTVRNDTGVSEGGEISIFYDPMIDKLVTHAPTRLAAIDLQGQALDAFYIDGIQHNIPFLTALMQHERWREARLSTGFIAEEYPNGFTLRDADGYALGVLAAVAASIDHLNNTRRRHITHQMDGEPFSFAKRRVVRIGARDVQLEVTGGGDAPIKVAKINADGTLGAPIEVVSSWWPGEPVWTGTVGGEAVSVQVRPLLNGVHLSYRGAAAEIRVYTQAEAALASLMPAKVSADTSKLLLCPMPGLVKSIHVQVGQEVKAGDTLAVVEAMKMENVLRAERDGAVKKINARAGDSLAVDAVILEFA